MFSMQEFAQLVSWKYSSGANYFLFYSSAYLIGIFMQFRSHFFE